MYSACRVCSIALCLAACVWTGRAQTPDSFPGVRDYYVNYWVSVPGIVAGAVTNSIGLQRTRDKKWYSPDVLDGLDASRVPAFDRIALRMDASRYIRAERNSDFGITWGTLLPATLLIADKRMRKDWLDIAIVYIETQTALSNFYGWSVFGPTLIERKRPIMYYEEIPLDERLWGGNRNSFYSGHVAVTATTTFFMAQSYLDYHPEKRHLKWLYYGLASLPPAYVGVKRLQALKHFPSDIVAGFVIGAAGGIIWPRLHYKLDEQSVQLSLLSDGRSGQLRCLWKL